VLAEELKAFMDGMEFGIIDFTSRTYVTVVMVKLLGGTVVDAVGSYTIARVAILYLRAISV
jgi:hypothetical protein